MSCPMPVEHRVPPHAYIPGKTARHAEGWFDDIRASVAGAGSETDLANSQAFLTGLNYLEQGYYWEAHEVLEPVWMACPQGSEPRALVQGLIQLANARLKILMDRPKAARRLYAIAWDHLDSIGSETVMGQSIATWRAIIASEKNAL